VRASFLQAVARLAKVAERKGSNRATMLFPMCWSYKWRLDAQFLTRSSLGNVAKSKKSLILSRDCMMFYTTDAM